MHFSAVTLALLLVAAPGWAQAEQLAAGQEWSGRYRCAQGDTPLIVQIREVGTDEAGSSPDRGVRVRAAFFFGGRGKPQGAFYLNGRYVPQTGEVELAPDRWIQRPAGYSAVGMTGRISNDGHSFVGRIDGPLCSDFTLTRTASANAARAPDTQPENAGGSSEPVTSRAGTSARPTSSAVPAGQLPSRRLVSLGTQLGDESAAILDRLPAPRVDPADLAAPCVNTGFKFADHDADYDWQKYAGIEIWNSNRLFHWAKAHLPLARFERQGTYRGDKGCLDGQFIARAWQATFGLPVTGILTAKDAEPLASVVGRVKKGEPEPSDVARAASPEEASKRSRDGQAGSASAGLGRPAAGSSGTERESTNVLHRDTANSGIDRATIERMSSTEKLAYCRETGLSDATTVARCDRILAFGAALSNVQRAQALMMKGNALVDLERFSEAVQVLTDAISLTSTQYPGYLFRAAALRKQGNYSDALKDVESVLAIHHPASLADAYEEKGIILTELRRYSEALKSFDTALQLRPNDDRIRSNRDIAIRRMAR